MGSVHAKHQTPHLALAFGAIVNFIVVAALSGNAESDTFGWYGTIASFGFIVVYFLVSVAAPVYLKRVGEMTTGDAVVGGLGAVLMVVSLIGSLYPIPAYPYNLLPYGFVAYMLIGVAWFLVVKSKAPATLLGVERDFEAAALSNAAGFGGAIVAGE